MAKSQSPSETPQELIWEPFEYWEPYSKNKLERCSRCDQMPLMCIYDDLLVAACSCFQGKTLDDAVRAESINSVMNREVTSHGYHRNHLFKAWNKYAKTGKVNTLKNGRW